MSTLQVTAPDVSCDNHRRNVEQDRVVGAVALDWAAKLIWLGI